MRFGGHDTGAYTSPLPTWTTNMSNPMTTTRVVLVRSQHRCNYAATRSAQPSRGDTHARGTFVAADTQVDSRSARPYLQRTEPSSRLKEVSCITTSRS